MTWRDFFNQPRNVFGLIITLVTIWLLFHPQVIADLINNVIMPLLVNLLVFALIIYGIKYMIWGPKKKGK